MCDSNCYQNCGSNRCAVLRLCPVSCNGFYNCPPQCPPVINDIAYVNTVVTPTPVPSGGTPLPANTIIPNGSTAVPGGTVTVINGWGAPSSNIGNLVSNNGFFTIPLNGRVIINTTVAFDAVATTAPATDLREVFIYRVAANSGLVTQIGAQTVVPVAANPTQVNVTAEDVFSVNDRVFVAARQINGAAAAVPVSAPTRISIFKA